ncbi:MAG: TIGR02221 family CRISPR-associated protein [Puniceicoccaceae bacterium]
MNRLLTFLGTSNYQSTIYALGDQSIEARFCSLALAKLQSFEQIDIFLTPRVAESTSWQTFQADSTGLATVEAHLIPNGANEGELWDIFRRICDVVEQGDVVTLDLTLGFRSVAIFSSTIAQFLQTARQATVKGVYYGAFEAKNPDTGHTPIFEISALQSLIRWSFATEAFERNRNLSDLASLLESGHREAYRHPNRNASPRQMQSAARHLRRIGESWINMRTVEFSKHNENIDTSLNNDLADETLTWAAPFAQIIERVRSSLVSYQGLALTDLQRKMIFDYADSGNLIQAVSLAREWLISRVASEIGCPEIAAPPFPDRKEFETFITSFAVEKTGQPPKTQTFRNHNFSSMDAIEFDLALLWNKLSDLRNDLDHCGFRQNPRTIDQILKQTHSILSQLP